MAAERPVQKEFRSRVDAAIAALEGYPGAPRSLTQLASDAGLSLPNLTSVLRLRRTMTWPTLQRLHRALKLDALGFELDLWDACADDPQRFTEMIRGKRDGDPVELVRPYAGEDGFFRVNPAGAFMGVRPGVTADAEERPGLVVFPGQSLQLSVTLPLSGFLKVICREGAEFFSLDQHLGLTRRRFEADITTPIQQALDVEPGYFGETIFIGLAATEPFEADWPRGHGPNDLVSRETLADLLRALFERPRNSWQACVYSVWTLPQEATQLS
jgi:hypothetical protein